MRNSEKVLVYAAMSLTLIAVVAFASLNFSLGITGNIADEQPYNYMYTKAICDSSNYCEDYHIECQDEGLVKMTPTGF